jgi:3-oxoacyl-[acyl-carrier-protein] synthase-1
LAARECLDSAGIEPASFDGMLPLLLCTAELERPGRLEDLDERLFANLQAALALRVDTPHSAIMPLGRTAVLAALGKARQLVADGQAEQVLIVAADGLLSWPALKFYLDADRVLEDGNSNGFIPGEGAGALLVTAAKADDTLLCIGFGSAFEPAPLSSDEPLRGDGLTAAVSQALRESSLGADDIDFIAADLSGEQYFFKEAALARGRALRGQTRQLELWHPAEGTGEAGALAGAAVIAVLWFAMHKGYACGPRVLVHGSGDGEDRFAAIFRARETR